VKDYKQEKIPEYNHPIKVKQMIEDEPKPGLNKTEVNMDLRLADVNVSGVKTRVQIYIV
jgi:hypothetical protein